MPQLRITDGESHPLLNPVDASSSAANRQSASYQKNMYPSSSFVSPKLVDSNGASNEANAAANGVRQGPVSSSRIRYESIDILRGIDLWIMIFVNMASDGTYGFMHHSHWNGLTLADFCFPIFVFLVGMSTLISTNSQLNHPDPAKRVSRHVILGRSVVRALKMALLGVLVINPFNAVCGFVYYNQPSTLSGWSCDLYTLPLWDVVHMRLPGVLQRIAAAYFITTIIILYVPKIGGSNKNAPAIAQEGFSINRREGDAQTDSASDEFSGGLFVPYLLQWAVVGSIVSVYLILLFKLPLHSPSCHSGSLTPECNAARSVDIAVFGRDRMYQWPTCLPDCDIFDPEGILGTLTAVLSCYLGVHAARILIGTKNNHKKQFNLYVGFVLLMAATALSLHFTDTIPVNKNLWSISYVATMAGTAVGFLWILIVIVDVLHAGRVVFAPFKWMGMNSIALYVGSETLPNLASMVFANTPDKNAWWGAQQLIYSWADEPVAGLLFSAVVSCFWLGVAGLLYWRRVFFKL
eukprot:ANDGO_01008.mRNA.1 transmembrane protein